MNVKMAWFQAVLHFPCANGIDRRGHQLRSVRIAFTGSSESAPILGLGSLVARALAVTFAIGGRDRHGIVQPLASIARTFEPYASDIAGEQMTENSGCLARPQGQAACALFSRDDRLC